jgi:hypothetical protein
MTSPLAKVISIFKSTPFPMAEQLHNEYLQNGCINAVKRQDQILSCLYVRCAQKLEAKFMGTDHYNPEENAESWPWWS